MSKQYESLYINLTCQSEFSDVGVSFALFLVSQAIENVSIQFGFFFLVRCSNKEICKCRYKKLYGI